MCHVFSGDLWAGAEVAIFNLLCGLQEQRGLRVLALSLNEGMLTERLRQAGIATHVIPEARHGLGGILTRARRVLRGADVTILHSHRYKENLLAWLLARGLGISQLITTMHGLPESPTIGERAGPAHPLEIGGSTISSCGGSSPRSWRCRRR